LAHPDLALGGEGTFYDIGNPNLVCKSAMGVFDYFRG
jgi:hypothetical protein